MFLKLENQGRGVEMSVLDHIKYLVKKSRTEKDSRAIKKLK